MSDKSGGQPVPVSIYDVESGRTTGQSATRVLSGQSCRHCHVSFGSHESNVYQLGNSATSSLAHKSCQQTFERRNNREAVNNSTLNVANAQAI